MIDITQCDEIGPNNPKAEGLVQSMNYLPSLQVNWNLHH